MCNNNLTFGFLKKSFNGINSFLKCDSKKNGPFLAQTQYGQKDPNMQESEAKNMLLSPVALFLFTFTNKILLFDVDLFSWTFHMDSPNSGIPNCLKPIFHMDNHIE